MSARVERGSSLIEGKLCPVCFVKTKVVARWMGFPSWRKCLQCERVWETGW